MEQAEHQWAKMSSLLKAVNESLNQPMTSLVELNSQTLNRSLSENNKYIQKFLDAKKPEEFMGLCAEMANKGGREITRYSQELFNIGSDTTAAVFKLCNAMTQEAIKAGEKFKSAAETE